MQISYEVHIAAVSPGFLLIELCNDCTCEETHLSLIGVEPSIRMYLCLWCLSSTSRMSSIMVNWLKRATRWPWGGHKRFSGWADSNLTLGIELHTMKATTLETPTCSLRSFRTCVRRWSFPESSSCSMFSWWSWSIGYCWHRWCSSKSDITAMSSSIRTGSESRWLGSCVSTKHQIDLGSRIYLKYTD